MILNLKKTLFISFILIGTTVFSQNKDGIITLNSPKEVEDLLDRKVNHLKNTKTSTYKIQIFYGSESGAVNSRRKYLSLFPNGTISLIYDAPDWKVHTGRYATKLLADKALEEVKLVFGNAFVLEKK
jgi:hypothetical protein